MTTSHDTTILKRCTKCGTEFPATPEYFYANKGTKSGMQSHCKACARLYQVANAKHLTKEQRQIDAAAANRERQYRADKIQQMQQYRADNAEEIAEEVAEEVAEGQRQWNAAKRKLASEYNRQRHADNPIRFAEYNRQWRAANPEYSRQYNHANTERLSKKKHEYRQTDAGKAVMRAAFHNRRARKLAAGGTHTAADIATLRAGQTDKRGVLHCWWCACAIDGNAYHVDHRVPLAKGGDNSAGNLCIACPTCNMRKGAKLPSDWNGRLL